jgi:hypothetical protein
MKGHSSRIDQTEDRISQFEDEMVIEGKAKELLVKQLKTSDRNMQEFTDSIKRPNLRIMGIEEGEEVQAKGIHNIFNKITENFPSVEKTMPSRYRKPSEHQTDLSKIEIPHDILLLKQQAQKMERSLMLMDWKNQHSKNRYTSKSNLHV